MGGCFSMPLNAFEPLINRDMSTSCYDAMGVFRLKNRRSAGFALLEVLIAMVVFAVGMLGVAALLIIAHKTSGSNYIKQTGVQYAYNILDRMRANSQAAINGNYAISNLVSSGSPTVPGAASSDCSASVCSATQMAAYDTWYWLAKELALLPAGCGSVVTARDVNGDTSVTITVQWDDSLAQARLGANGATSSGSNAQFIVSTLL